MPEDQRIGRYRRIEIDRRSGCRIVIRDPAYLYGCWDGFWTILFWVFGELACIYALLTSLHGQTLPGHPSLFLILAVTIGWTLVGWLFVQALRSLSPAEESLSVEDGVFVVARMGLMNDDVQRYPLASIRDLRYSPLREELSFGNREGLWDLGSIRFEVDNAPHYFGAGLTAEESQALIEVLEKAFGMPAAEV